MTLHLFPLTRDSGGGVRIQHRRFVAGSLAILVASVAMNASAVTLDLDMVTIGNPGNPAFFSNNLGNVSYTYGMARYETTNSQYVEYLNAVGATNPNGIYDPQMGSDGNGGIIQSGSPGSYAYSVRVGTNPAGKAYANVPINFVTWFGGARFANWMHNGQSANPADLEIGAYTLANATSGPLVSRSPGATYALPSIDEWAKAGYHNGGMTDTSYTIFPTNNDTRPESNFVTPSTFNVANYGGTDLGAVGPLEVGSYINSRSQYGLFEMIGNIAEMTETAKSGAPTEYLAMSGSFSTRDVAIDQWSLGSLGSSSVLSNNPTAQIGFRLVAVQPVPEPGTIAIACAGLAGIAFLGWRRRRQAVDCL